MDHRHSQQNLSIHKLRGEEHAAEQADTLEETYLCLHDCMQQLRGEEHAAEHIHALQKTSSAANIKNIDKTRTYVPTATHI